MLDVRCEWQLSGKDQWITADNPAFHLRAIALDEPARGLRPAANTLCEAACGGSILCAPALVEAAGQRINAMFATDYGMVCLGL